MLPTPSHPETPPKMRLQQYLDRHPWKAFFHVLAVLWVVSEALFAYADRYGQTLVGEWAGGGARGLLFGALIWVLFATECAVVICGSRRVLRPLVDWAKESSSRKGVVLAAGFLFGVACLVWLWIQLPPFLILIWVLMGLIAMVVMRWANRKNGRG